MNTLVKCRVNGCNSQSVSTELCQKHYTRNRRYGDPEYTKYSMDNHEQITKAVNTKDAVNCIDYSGGKDKDGYGVISVKGKLLKAHRYVLSLFTNTPYSNDRLCLHMPTVCHNPSCINPYHLRWGSPKDNSHDKTVDDTVPTGIGHANGKLTDDDIRAIRKAVGTLQAIADQYGIAKSTVGNIKHKRNRGNVPD